MVYSLELLGLDGNNEILTQAVLPSTKAVEVYFNGSGIGAIAGPTPTIDLSSSIERNDAGELLVINNKITLNGKITRGLNVSNPGDGSGISAVLSGIQQISSIFKKNNCGLLEVKCGAPSASPPQKTIYSATGVRVVSLDFNKTNDNWVFTADYAVVLEYLEPANSGWYVKSYSDSWNIEPLEDYIYINDKMDVTLKQEYDPSPFKLGSTPQNSQTSNGSVNNETVSVGYVNIPRYKVSRTISAVGIPSGNYCSGTNIDFRSYPAITLSAFLNAKAWVEARSSSTFAIEKKPQGKGAWSPIVDGYAYNHLRSVNFDILSAKYEITDSWLAMPTGISFVEDYSLELSTDDKYMHTVRIQGEIKGLSIVDPIITGQPIVSGSGGIEGIKFNFASSTGLLTIPDLNPTNTDSMQPSPNLVMKRNAYANALSGWIYDVKPYLYRRASMAMSIKDDRTKGYVSPTTNPPPPPKNPVYCIHNVLNIIPISTSESYNPKNGTVSYSYEFNNKFTIISGVIYENISVEENGPTDVIAEAFVLGRSLGPVLQNLGTKTATRKSVTIEIGVVPPTSVGGLFMQNRECPLWTGGTVYNTITGIMEGMKPFGDRPDYIFGSASFYNRGPTDQRGQVFVTQDNHTWDPANGRYSRTIGWVYQQCSNSRLYLDY